MGSWERGAPRVPFVAFSLKLYIQFIKMPNEANMSESSSKSDTAPSEASSVHSDSDGLERLCRRVHRKLAVSIKDSLSVAEHQAAAGLMMKSRDMLLRGCELSQSAHTSLLCSGVAVLRRVNTDVETEETCRLLKVTLALLFSLLVLSGGQTELEQDEFEQVEEDASGKKKRPPRRLMREDEELLACWGEATLADTVIARDENHASSWSELVRSSSSVCQAALKEARYVKDPDAMALLQDLAVTFFRCKSADMMLNLLSDVDVRAEKTGGKRDALSFLTLDTVGMLNEANELQEDKLASIVDAAESEAGQATLRDIILSFKLPRLVVGVRRVLMLSREANATATKSYTETLNAAHEAAMRGADWTWANDSDEIHKISAVLAGLAIILAKTPDAIRKGDAFSGRLVLPFIECSPPSAGVVRLGLVEETGEWVVFSVSDAGTPRVRFRGVGFGGFCESALLFSKNIRT